VTRPPDNGDAVNGDVSPARAAALATLRRLRGTTQRLDDSARALPELSDLGRLDRALANELVMGTIKRRATLDAVLGRFTKAPLETCDRDVRDVLRLAAYQLLFLERVPSYAVVDDAVRMVAPMGKRRGGFVNAVLRRTAAEGRAQLAVLGDGEGTRAWAVRLSYPPWLVALLRRDLGDEAAQQLLMAGNAAPERCLRVNRRLTDVAAARQALAAAGFVTSGVAGLPDALLYEGPPPLEAAAPFRAGLVTPQSRGSQIVGVVAATGVAARGDAVLDLCAAPGAKTSQLAALLPETRLTALEIDERRGDELRANLARLGVSAVEVVRGDALELPQEYAGAFAAVLLDAPCSGLGTLSSRADLRWRRRAADVPRLAALQRDLLASAATAVAPGGTLTYAVCTVSRVETLDVVASLLSRGGWEVDDLSPAWPRVTHPAAGGYLLVLPPAGGSSGFFVARLRRCQERAR